MIESLIYALHQRIKDDDQTKHLLMQFVSLKTYLCEQCTVEKKMYNGDKRRYLFHRGDSYVAYDEFIASLPDAQYCFVTTNKQKQTTLDITPKDHIPPSIALTTAPSIKQIIKHLTGVSPQSHFIFSTSKKHSKDLFQAMVQEKIHDTYTIVAENIT